MAWTWDPTHTALGERGDPVHPSNLSSKGQSPSNIRSRKQYCHQIWRFANEPQWSMVRSVVCSRKLVRRREIVTVDGISDPGMDRNSSQLTVRCHGHGCRLKVRSTSGSSGSKGPLGLSTVCNWHKTKLARAGISSRAGRVLFFFLFIESGRSGILGFQ